MKTLWNILTACVVILYASYLFAKLESEGWGE